MKEFLTMKVIKAEEMSRQEYVDSRGWTLPENEKHLADERVYKVFYEDGYISMCPKERFLENAYEIKGYLIDESSINKVIKNVEFTTKKIFGKKAMIMEYQLKNGFIGTESLCYKDSCDDSEKVLKEVLFERLRNKIWNSLEYSYAIASSKHKKGDTDGDNN